MALLPDDVLVVLVWIARLLLPALLFWISFGPKVQLPWPKWNRRTRNDFLRVRGVMSMGAGSVPDCLSNLKLVTEETAPHLFQDKRSDERGVGRRRNSQPDRDDGTREARREKRKEAVAKAAPAAGGAGESASALETLEAEARKLGAQAHVAAHEETRMHIESLVNFVAFNRHKPKRHFLLEDGRPPPPPRPKRPTMPEATDSQAIDSDRLAAAKRANTEAQMVLLGALRFTNGGSEVAVGLHAQLQDLGLEVWPATYELMVELCLEAADLEGASDFLLKMESTGHSPGNELLDRVMELYLQHKHEKTEHTKAEAPEEDALPVAASAPPSRMPSITALSMPTTPAPPAPAPLLLPATPPPPAPETEAAPDVPTPVREALGSPPHFAARSPDDDAPVVTFLEAAPEVAASPSIPEQTPETPPGHEVAEAPEHLAEDHWIPQAWPPVADVIGSKTSDGAGQAQHGSPPPPAGVWFHGSQLPARPPGGFAPLGPPPMGHELSGGLRRRRAAPAARDAELPAFSVPDEFAAAFAPENHAGKERASSEGSEATVPPGFSAVPSVAASQQEYEWSLNMLPGHWHRNGDPSLRWTIELDGRSLFNGRYAGAAYDFVEEFVNGMVSIYAAAHRANGEELDLANSTRDRLIWTQNGVFSASWERAPQEAVGGTTLSADAPVFVPGTSPAMTPVTSGKYPPHPQAYVGHESDDVYGRVGYGQNMFAGMVPSPQPHWQAQALGPLQAGPVPPGVAKRQQMLRSYTAPRGVPAWPGKQDFEAGPVQGMGYLADSDADGGNKGDDVKRVPSTMEWLSASKMS